MAAPAGTTARPRSSPRSAMSCRMRAWRKSISGRPGHSPSCRSRAIAARWCGRSRPRRRGDPGAVRRSSSGNSRGGSARGGDAGDRAAAGLSARSLHRRALHRPAAGAARRCRACRPSDRRARPQSRLARCSGARGGGRSRMPASASIWRGGDTAALQAWRRFDTMMALRDRRAQPAVLE